MATKIEWTDVLIPMTAKMTRYAECANIKPVRARIPEMMMVVSRRLPTAKTREIGWRRKPAIAYRGPHCIDCLIRLSCGWGRQNTPTPNLYTTTLNTLGSVSISTAFISIKQGGINPRPASAAELLPRGDSRLVFFNGCADPSRGDLHDTNSRSHSNPFRLGTFVPTGTPYVN